MAQPKRDPRVAAARRRTVWTALALGCLLGAALLATAPAFARMGGGQDYGSGSSGGGGGGSYDGGGGISADLIILLIRLVIQYPKVGVPVVLIVIGYAVIKMKMAKGRPVPLRAAAAARAMTAAAPPRSLRAAPPNIGLIAAADPGFSLPVFLDFIQLLYARVQQYRWNRGLDAVSAFLEPRARAALERKPEKPQLQPRDIESVITGAIRILDVSLAETVELHVHVEIEANYTEIYEEAPGGQPGLALYVKEEWLLVKQRNAVSLPPERLRSLSCPNCGASGELTLEGRCQYCDTVVNTGQFSWVVRRTDIKQREPRRIKPLTSGGIEAGTDLPTIYHPSLPAQRKTFQARNPGFSWRAFEQMVKDRFIDIQAAWTDLQWERVRPFLTGHMFDSQRFWLDQYRYSDLNNRIEQIEVQRVLPVKITVDAYYEAITVRIWASAVDFTVNRDGKVVEGSNTKRRTFSEYWTFIRRQREQLQTRDEFGEQNSATCPNCGAELPSAHTAICPYCRSQIFSSEFDWVLSLVEQDEAYSG